MKHAISITYIFFLAFVLMAALLVTDKYALALETSVINATVSVAVCGNGIKEGGEQCDQSDFKGKSCTNLGFEGGTLYCSSSCSFDTTSCTTGATAAGAVPILSGTSDMNYTLQDGVHSLDIGMPQGFYPGGDLSLLLFSFPTFYFDSEKPAPPGKNAAGKLYSLFFVDEEGSIVHTLSLPTTITLSYTLADTDSIDVDTLAPYRSEDGSSTWAAVPGYTRDTNAKTITFSTDNFSSFAIFGLPKTVVVNNGGGVGGGSYNYPKISPEERTRIIKIADFNADGRVDIIDFSILLFYNGKSDRSIVRYDLNDDGKVDIVDISIMLYYWGVTK